MDKKEFIRCYKDTLLFTPSSTHSGVEIIKNYIAEEGNDYHKIHLNDFLGLLNIPPLYTHCLQWAIDYFVNKYSVVIITDEDPNVPMKHAKVITIY